MKKILNTMMVALLSCTILSVSGCTSFLDVSPELGLTEDEVFSYYDNTWAYFSQMYVNGTGADRWDYRECWPLFMNVCTSKQNFDFWTPSSVGGRESGGTAPRKGSMQVSYPDLHLSNNTASNTPVMMAMLKIIRICNMHPRVNILQPGPGVGGHCISVDPWFLVGDYPQLAKVIDESMKTNDYQPVFVLERIHEIMEAHGITDNRRVGLYGLTYKENVDDIRESPTLQMLDIQERHLARPLKTFDPFFTEKAIVKNQLLDFDQFLSEVDMVVIMVKHDHIKHNWDKLKGKVILDCHNICPMEGVYHI